MAGSFESDANDRNMVKRAPSTNSDASSSEKFPSYTALGRKPVPVVSSCQGLYSALEEHRGDIPFCSEIIRRATVDFTDNQLVLVNDVLEAAVIESRYRFDRQFYVALVALGESLETRIKDENKFYAAQKERYSDIYGIVRQSSFPFSANQGACLYRMVGAVYQLTGHPDSESDKEFVRSLRDLIRLVKSGDHLRDPSPHRFIIIHTLHYYLHEMLLKVRVLSREEEVRAHPDFIHPHGEIDLASYIELQLEALVDMSKVTTPRDHFHYGMVEVYTRLVNIFRESGLDFSNRQEVILQKAERNIRVLRKEPFMRKHQAIVDALMEFMSELEEDNPDREVKLEGMKVVWAEEGKVNKAVREIVWDLVYLQPVATEHLINFSTFGFGVENVAAKIMERFLALYPLH